MNDVKCYMCGSINHTSEWHLERNLNARKISNLKRAEERSKLRCKNHPDREVLVVSVLLCASCYNVYLRNRTPENKVKFEQYQSKYNSDVKNKEKARHKARELRKNRTPEQKEAFRTRERNRVASLPLEKRKEYKLKSKYGIDYEEYKNLLESQSGCCAVCDATEQLHLDHNHSTGKVRGFLCCRHNTMLGYIENFSEDLKKLQNYKEVHDASS